MGLCGMRLDRVLHALSYPGTECHVILHCDFFLGEHAGRHCEASRRSNLLRFMAISPFLTVPSIPQSLSARQLEVLNTRGVKLMDQGEDDTGHVAGMRPQQSGKTGCETKPTSLRKRRMQGKSLADSSESVLTPFLRTYRVQAEEKTVT
ncbi:hypothetical protein V8C44DRAFT_122167 [Trichoderma aethiopicum]